ncbi:hypothetical protein PROSTU_04352, partial [Providencia stuartii ATCC 25827]
ALLYFLSPSFPIYLPRRIVSQDIINPCDISIYLLNFNALIRSQNQDSTSVLPINSNELSII